VRLLERVIHLDDKGVDIEKFGAHVDEVSIVAIDEVDELMIEYYLVGLTLGMKVGSSEN
jgi:hypothetical protein